MYFAAFSFWTTGLTAIIVTMLNPPGPNFRVTDAQNKDNLTPSRFFQLIRTTFQTKNSLETRPDERVPKETAEMEVLNPVTGDAVKLPEKCPDSPAKATACLCPDNEADFNRTLAEDDLADLNQTPLEKAVLYGNLIVILGVAVGFYVYFSINPFTAQEIQDLQSAALRNISRQL